MNLLLARIRWYYNFNDGFLKMVAFMFVLAYVNFVIYFQDSFMQIVQQNKPFAILAILVLLLLNRRRN